MEAIISDLLNRFEKGALTRRGLIRGLTMLTAAGGASEAQVPGANRSGRESHHRSASGLGRHKLRRAQRQAQHCFHRGRFTRFPRHAALFAATRRAGSSSL